MADEPDESLANVEAQPDETRSDESPTPKNLEPEEVLQFLRMTDFDSVRCTRESERLDFKSGCYRLEEEHEKLELAKDVAAFANANGGYIVRGVKTKRLHTADEEVAWELKPIPHAMVDLCQWPSCCPRSWPLGVLAGGQRKSSRLCLLAGGAVGEPVAVAGGVHQRNASLIFEVSLCADAHASGLYGDAVMRRRALLREPITEILSSQEDRSV